uniref:Small monomeric GTPase n=1 Tax=Branchiostoma floridae TaxID=7739 RepID=C3YF77_BRAFL|eukprot:XP_002605069.1 hypothetical protein BRAFLDRAFT_85215 [Branchiostoma floridae]
MSSHLVDECAAPPKNCFRLVVLGTARVGKTAIVSRFLFNQYDDQYTPTIEDFHRKMYRIRGEVYRLDILDTSGVHPFPAMRRLSFLTGQMDAIDIIELSASAQPAISLARPQMPSLKLNLTKCIFWMTSSARVSECDTGRAKACLIRRNSLACIQDLRTEKGKGIIFGEKIYQLPDSGLILRKFEAAAVLYLSKGCSGRLAGPFVITRCQVSPLA